VTRYAILIANENKIIMTFSFILFLFVLVLF